MKLPVLVISIILIIIGIYLNRVYANFFNRIGEYELSDPYLELNNAEITIGDPTKGETLYLVLGDSLSRGVGTTSYKNTFPYLIMQKEPSLRVINKARPGARLAHVFAQLESAESLKPSIVTVLIGTNDVFNRTPIKTFAQDYERLLGEVDKTDAKVIVITIPYLGSPDAVPFPFDYLLNESIKRYNAEIKTVVQNHPRVRLLDLYELSYGSFKNSRDLYSKDLFHPSDKGYMLISDLLSHENYSP